MLRVHILGMVRVRCVLPMRQLRFLLAVWVRHDMLQTLLQILLYVGLHILW